MGDGPPGNDPAAARALMTRFYRLLAAGDGEAGCDPEDPRLGDERALLVRSYAALPAVVHR